MSDFGEDFMLCGEDEEDYGLVSIFSAFFVTPQLLLRNIKKNTFFPL